MSAPPGHMEMVSVFGEDPDLARGLPHGTHESARSAALAPLVTWEPGVQATGIGEPPTQPHLGYLVLDGLITVHLRFGSIWSTELLGPSDVFLPWAMSTRVEVAEARWEALAPTRLAELDGGFATRVRPWPELTAALLDRYAERLASQLLQSALRKARRVEDRIWVALWHFATRWGRVCADGRRVELPKVTGEVLANIVGARRQSVSTALTLLTDRGAIHREPDGGWLILQEPPHLGLEAARAPQLAP
jgi:CRP/FNR family transcriptional regulator, cyclic AMP receptor protein